MSEYASVERAQRPETVSTLVSSFRTLGLTASDTVIVHASLSSMGWVCGGAETVIEALLEVLGSDGTLVMPTHTAGNTDPKRWANPPVPEAWWPIIRENMPAFDPAKTPSRDMGVIAETFRTWPGVVRSNHPIGSFCARGPHAQRVIADDIFEPGEQYPTMSGAFVIVVANDF